MKQNPTVMVVDDNPLNLRLMEAMLATDKYNVVSYESGITCLEAICKELDCQPGDILEFRVED